MWNRGRWRERRVEFLLAFHGEAISSESVKAEFDRLVASHDKPEVEALIVSVGAPSAYGVRYPEEDFMFDYVPPTFTAQHIKMVMAHAWAANRLRNVLPA